MEIPQKNVAYIGGCGGIGSMMCKRFACKKVANLAILDLVENVDLIEDIKVRSASTNVFFLKIDLRCKETIKKSLNEVNTRMGRIDILINGSGLFNENDAELTIGVNLLGLINCTMTALEFMDKSKGNHGGLIVNIASVAGLIPLNTSPVYCASKAGVVLFTRSMAGESNFEQTGVSFIAICPGATTTGLLDQFTSENKTPHAKHIEATLNAIKKQTPDELAQNIMAAIEENKNGAVYVCDAAIMKEITFPEFWVPERL